MSQQRPLVKVFEACLMVPRSFCSPYRNSTVFFCFCFFKRMKCPVAPESGIPHSLLQPRLIPTDDRQPSGEESIASSISFNPAEPSTNTLFLSLPNPSTNKSRSSFVLSDDELPPEIANADIFIASESPFFLFFSTCRIRRGLRKSRPTRASSCRTEEGYACYCTVLQIVPATCTVTDPSPSGSGHTGYRFL